MLCLICCNVYNENILHLKTILANHFQAIGPTILATEQPSPASHWLWQSNWWLTASTTKRSTSATGPTTQSQKGATVCFLYFSRLLKVKCLTTLLKENIFRFNQILKLNKYGNIPKIFLEAGRRDTKFLFFIQKKINKNWQIVKTKKIINRRTNVQKK